MEFYRRYMDWNWLGEGVQDYASVVSGDLFENTKKYAIFYCQHGLLQGMINKKLEFIVLLCHDLVQLGLVPVLMAANKDDALIEHEQIALHIWMHDTSPTGSVDAPVYHSIPSYIRGFWYFDRDGVRNLSSIQYEKFDPKQLNRSNVERFYERLNKLIISRERTKHSQKKRGGDAQIPEGCIAIAAQQFQTPEHYACYLDYHEIIATTITAANGRPVLIKPHPLTNTQELAELNDYHQPDKGVWVQDCNLFEMLEKAEIVVTRCSAVALEAMFFDTPAIVCAQVDFHHAVYTARNSEAIAKYLQANNREAIDYEAFLFWFLKKKLFMPRDAQHCLRRFKKILHPQIMSNRLPAI